VAWWIVAISFLGGLLLAFLLASMLGLFQRRNAREIAAELFSESEARRRSELEAIIENLKACFGNLSLEALSRSTDQLLRLAQERLHKEREVGLQELESKKSLIDRQLGEVGKALEGVSNLVRELERDRSQKFAELITYLKTTSEQTAALMQTTNLLREALASTKARGQWGERMAEDILRLAGLVEGLNYLKQEPMEGGGRRPDYTFLLPGGYRLNMDVKFPLDNYLRFLQAESETDRKKFRNDFLRDVLSHIKALSSREYIDPEQQTLDYALLFIPNEQIFAFLHEQDQDHRIQDESIRRKVVICSPVTLFAVLALIRQVTDHFALTRSSPEILEILDAFRKQWKDFTEHLEKLGKKIQEADEVYHTLARTRRRQLEKYLDRVEELRLRGAAIPTPVPGPGREGLAAEELPAEEPEEGRKGEGAT